MSTYRYSSDRDRYSSHRRTRGGFTDTSWGSHPVAVLFSVVFLFSVSVFVGWRLDTRRGVFGDGAGAAVDAGARASLGVIDGARGAGATDPYAKAVAQVERLSGVSGPGPFSLRSWLPSQPVFVEGVDVSAFFAQEFTLRNSMRSDYTLTRVSFSPRWSGPERFLEVGSGGTRNGATLLRFTADGVEPFFVSRSGLRVPIPQVSGERRKRCSHYDVVAHEQSLVISCDSSVQLEIPVGIPAKGTLFVNSNLLRGELEDLIVVGKVGGSEVEDRG